MVKLVYCDNIIVGGQAVYAARSLYETIEPTIYNDDAICGAIGISQKTDQTTTTANGYFSVVPNPATNTVTFKYEFANNMPNTIVVYNNIGQVVSQTSLNATTSTTLDVSQLPIGVYCCQLMLNKQAIAIQKLVIIR